MLLSTTTKGFEMSQVGAITKTKINEELKEPPMFKVIYLNDSQTTVEFVIETLMNFFDYTPDTAVKITQDIHEAGSAIVAVLPYEVAEQKGIEVTVHARSNNYPLQVKLEPENI
jgi:ATP-dependent Clp protease adaptor protein ClpS